MVGTSRKGFVSVLECLSCPFLSPNFPSIIRTANDNEYLLSARPCSKHTECVNSLSPQNSFIR